MVIEGVVFVGQSLCEVHLQVSEGASVAHVRFVEVRAIYEMKAPKRNTASRNKYRNTRLSHRL